MDGCPGHFLESTKEIEMKLSLKIDDIKRKGCAHKPSPVNHFFHNRCLSRSYLGKYKSGINETWFIDR